MTSTNRTSALLKQRCHALNGSENERKLFSRSALLVRSLQQSNADCSTPLATAVLICCADSQHQSSINKRPYQMKKARPALLDSGRLMREREFHPVENPDDRFVLDSVVALES